MSVKQQRFDSHCVDLSVLLEIRCLNYVQCFQRMSSKTKVLVICFVVRSTPIKPFGLAEFGVSLPRAESFNAFTGSTLKIF